MVFSQLKDKQFQVIKFKMSYDHDKGQFNDSTVFLPPVSFNQRTQPILPRQVNTQHNNLGIYDDIKLSSLMDNKQGQLIEFINYAEHSHNTFVTNEALNLLQKYATQEICFVVIVGEQTAGKSFFCDKILNLSEIRGNHFCRKKNSGINIWSTPFEKEDLKIFLLEINNCQFDSLEFKLLATYALLIGSTFVAVDGLKAKESSSIKKLDEVISSISEKIGSSILEKENQIKSAQVIMPKTFFHFHRPSGKKCTQNLKNINFYSSEELPDALVKGYFAKEGKQSEHLIQLPFLDTKCVSSQYIRRTSSIFRDIYSKCSEKRYKQLVLNGNIISKVIRYIQNYLNNKNELNIQNLYLHIIEDLYLSAFNYCILSYHEDMQRVFDDQAPKPIDQLLEIFERVSDSTFEKFHQFNLDQRLYQFHFQKLQKHIEGKEQMIMEINLNKTQQIIEQLYDENRIGDIAYYRSFVEKVDREHRHLTHGRAEVMAKVNSLFYRKTKGNNNVDYLIMKQIQAMREDIMKKVMEHQFLTNDNKLLSKEKQAQLSARDKIQKKKSQIEEMIDRAMRMSMIDQTTQKKEIKEYQEKIKKNQKTIAELKESNYKDKRISGLQGKIEEVGKKITMQEKLLKELLESKAKTEKAPQKQKK